MLPSIATTTQLNGHYANQYPNQDDKLLPPHLPGNKAYTQYAPKVIIALSTLYLLVFLLHFLIKTCRKYRDKKQQREKQRLKLTWKKAMTKFELLQSKDAPNRLLYPDSTHNKQQSHDSSTSSVTLNNQSYSPPTIAAANHMDAGPTNRKHQPPSASSSFSSFATTSSSTTSGNSIARHQPNSAIASVEKTKNEGRGRRLSRHKFSIDRLTPYWKITNNKRLTLLWDWSIAMGYCEYNHAKDLADMVLRLQKYQEFASSKDTINLDDIVLVDE